MEAEVRRHAVHVLLHDTNLSSEVILGAFGILDKASARAAHLRAQGDAAQAKQVCAAGLMAEQSSDDVLCGNMSLAAFSNLMAAAFIAFKVYTPSSVVTCSDFTSQVARWLRHYMALVDLIKAERDVLQSIEWTIPTTTRYECVLEMLSNMALHDVVKLCATDCPLCTAPVHKPVKLPCGHTCCHRCVSIMRSNGFTAKMTCPACCSGVPALAQAHYNAVRTSMPLNKELRRATAYSLLAPSIRDDGLYARAVLWAAAHLCSERKHLPSPPSWVPHLYDDAAYLKSIVMRHGVSISTAYTRGQAGTLFSDTCMLLGKKRKLCAVV